MSLLISGLTSLASLLINKATGSTDKSGDARRQGESTVAGPSATVRWSPEAKALASLAGQGAMFAPAVSSTRAESVGLGAGGLPGQGAAGPRVSNEDFQALLGRFGADAEQQKLMVAGFDADKDGTISQAEFLQGLGRTARRGEADDISQALMRLMDGAGDGNGRVSKQEFSAFTAAFAAATRRLQA